jgi:hypothetical protein
MNVWKRWPKIGDERRAGLAWLTKLLLRIAIRRLPEALRERFSEEWASHINEVTGEINKVTVALGCISAARQVASSLKPSEPALTFYDGMMPLRRRRTYQIRSRLLRRTLDIMTSVVMLALFAPLF